MSRESVEACIKRKEGESADSRGLRREGVWGQVRFDSEENIEGVEWKKWAVGGFLRV